MNVTRDVVNDLLTVYLAGDASADTQALVTRLGFAPSAAPEFPPPAPMNGHWLGRGAQCLTHWHSLTRATPPKRLRIGRTAATTRSASSAEHAVIT